MASETLPRYERKQPPRIHGLLPGARHNSIATEPSINPNATFNVAGRLSRTGSAGGTTLVQSTSNGRGMLQNLDGLSKDSLRKEPFKLTIFRKASQDTQRINWSATPVKPVILRTSSEANFNHIRKSSDRINMSFDNARYWEIEKTNQFLSERLQKAKPTYTRKPSEPRIVRSRFELQKSKDFFDLQRDNSVSSLYKSGRDCGDPLYMCCMRNTSEKVMRNYVKGRHESISSGRTVVSDPRLPKIS